MSSENAGKENAAALIELDKTQSQDCLEGPKCQQDIASFNYIKKSKAEGLMDISLLTANANQLKFIFYYNQA